MPNGRPGDHPLTDLLVHNQHIFPADIEAMVRRLHAIEPSLLNDSELYPFDWTQGKGLYQGRLRLRSLLRDRGVDPDAFGPEPIPDAGPAAPLASPADYGAVLRILVFVIGGAEALMLISAFILNVSVSSDPMGEGLAAGMAFIAAAAFLLIVFPALRLAYKRRALRFALFLVLAPIIAALLLQWT